MTMQFRPLSLIVSASLILAGWLAKALGLFANALIVFLVLMVPVGIGLLVWHAYRGTLETRLWRAPRDPALRFHLVESINAVVFWLASAITVEACVMPAQLGSESLFAVRVTVWGAAIVLSVLAFLPGKRTFRLTTVALAVGWIFLTFQGAMLVWPESSERTVVLSPPFRGDWVVVQGGRSALINHHYGIRAQRHAVDLSKLADGRVLAGDKTLNPSYPSWGATLLAPADGTVAEVVGNLPDNPHGRTDAKHPVGNHITVDLGGGHFVLLAHLQSGSPRVAVGDRVVAGQPIARCGNSGNTSQPHLHIQVQNRLNFSAPDLETYPMAFRDATSIRGGQIRTDAPYVVRRNDRLIVE